jgi:hypothetical protein
MRRELAVAALVALAVYGVVVAVLGYLFALAGA